MNVWKTNPPLKRQMLEVYANKGAFSIKKSNMATNLFELLIKCSEQG